MVRFTHQDAVTDTSTRSTRRVTSRLRWRVWLLIIALGAVLGLMRKLNQPETAANLGRLFAATPEQQSEPTEPHIVITSGKPAPAPSAASAADKQATPSTDDLADDDPLAAVKDNTYFRTEETDAWFELFRRLQQVKPSQLAAESLGEITYAQLIKQPDYYRGKAVTLRGIVRREELKQPAENDLGLASYHRLIIQPRGGGHWPFEVYCVELPDAFPRGDAIKASVTVTGYFFKNKSYAWEDGLGLAPVVLASTVEWQPAPPVAKRAPISTGAIVSACLLAAVFAGLVVWIAVRNSRRPPRLPATGQNVTLPDGSEVATVEQRLQQLAQAEAD